LHQGDCKSYKRLCREGKIRRGSGKLQTKLFALQNALFIEPKSRWTKIRHVVTGLAVMMNGRLAYGHCKTVQKATIRLLWRTRVNLVDQDS